MNCNNRAYKLSDLQQLPPVLIDVMQHSSEVLDVPLFESTSVESNNNNHQLLICLVRPENNGQFTVYSENLFSFVTTQRVFWLYEMCQTRSGVAFQSDE